MKKTFAILMVAMIVTAMMSCGKHVDDGAALEDNTLMYNGKTYHMIPEVQYIHNGLTKVFAHSEELEENVPVISFGSGNSGGLHIEEWGKSIDLATPADGDHYELDFSGSVLNMYATGQNDHGTFYYTGNLDGQNFNDESVFNSGVLQIEGNNDGTPITVTMSGTLKNGKPLRMKLVSGSYTIF